MLTSSNPCRSEAPYCSRPFQPCRTCDRQCTAHRPKQRSSHLRSHTSSFLGSICSPNFWEGDFRHPKCTFHNHPVAQPRGDLFSRLVDCVRQGTAEFLKRCPAWLTSSSRSFTRSYRSQDIGPSTVRVTLRTRVHCAFVCKAGWPLHLMNPCHSDKSTEKSLLGFREYVWCASLSSFFLMLLPATARMHARKQVVVGLSTRNAHACGRRWLNYIPTIANELRTSLPRPYTTHCFDLSTLDEHTHTHSLRLPA